MPIVNAMGSGPDKQLFELPECLNGFPSTVMYCLHHEDDIVEGSAGHEKELSKKVLTIHIL